MSDELQGNASTNADDVESFDWLGVPGDTTPSVADLQGGIPQSDELDSLIGPPIDPTATDLSGDLSFASLDPDPGTLGGDPGDLGDLGGGPSIFGEAGSVDDLAMSDLSLESLEAPADTGLAMAGMDLMEDLSGNDETTDPFLGVPMDDAAFSLDVGDETTDEPGLTDPSLGLEDPSAQDAGPYDPYLDDPNILG